MADARPLRIGTRGSRLARWQADHVARRLQARWPDVRCVTVTFETAGDRAAGVPLPVIGDKGLFTRDIEQALLSGEIDLAVHSLKDLPTTSPPGLSMGAILDREDARDALVSASGDPLASLPPGARIGTSSLRRRAQLKALRPDVEIVDIRGNVPTRVEKVVQGRYDAVVLAWAGLNRLGLTDRVAEIFDEAALVPAPGQGALAVQTRGDDDRVLPVVAAIDDVPTRLATTTERLVLAILEGGCQAPLGAFARWLDSERLQLMAAVASVDEPRVLRAEAAAIVADRADAEGLAQLVSDDLRRRGADRILAAARGWVAALQPGGLP